MATNWQPVTGSDPVGWCIVCNELTPVHFWAPFKKDAREFIRPYYFCGDDCVKQFKDFLADWKPRDE